MKGKHSAIPLKSFHVANHDKSHMSACDLVRNELALLGKSIVGNVYIDVRVPRINPGRLKKWTPRTISPLSKPSGWRLLLESGGYEWPKNCQEFFGFQGRALKKPEAMDAPAFNLILREAT